MCNQLMVGHPCSLSPPLDGESLGVSSQVNMENQFENKILLCKRCRLDAQQDEERIDEVEQELLQWRLGEHGQVERLDKLEEEMRHLLNRCETRYAALEKARNQLRGISVKIGTVGAITLHNITKPKPQ